MVLGPYVGQFDRPTLDGLCTLFANLDRSDNAESFEILVGFSLTLRFLMLEPWPFAVVLERHLALSCDGCSPTLLSEDRAPLVDVERPHPHLGCHEIRSGFEPVNILVRARMACINLVMLSLNLSH